MKIKISADARHFIKKSENPLKDKLIKKMLGENSLKGMNLINKVNDELYNEKTTDQQSIKKIKRMLNKEDANNPLKIKNECEKRLLDNLDKSLIRNLLSFEIPIDLVLDNAKIHSSDLSLAVFEILNINPIFFTH